MWILLRGVKQKESELATCWAKGPKAWAVSELSLFWLFSSQCHCKSTFLKSWGISVPIGAFPFWGAAQIQSCHLPSAVMNLPVRDETCMIFFYRCSVSSSLFLGDIWSEAQLSLTSKWEIQTFATLHTEGLTPLVHHDAGLSLCLVAVWTGRRPPHGWQGILVISNSFWCLSSPALPLPFPSPHL